MNISANDTQVSSALAALHTSGIVFAVFDLNEEADYARRMGVKVSNTIHVYKERRFLRYWGQKLSLTVAEFAAAFLRPSLRVINTVEDRRAFKAYPDMKVIALLEKGSEDELEFDLASQDFIGVVPFYAVYSTAMAASMPELELTLGEIRLIKPLTPMIRREVRNVRKFVSSNMRQLLTRFRREVSNSGKRKISKNE